MFRIGILGAGAIARTMANTLRLMAYRGDDVCLYAVASRDQRKAEDFARREGAQVAYGSYELLASDPQVDLVYIATPHSHHAEHIELCLNAGRNVLCEKAFTANARQAERVLALAKEKKLLLAEAIWTRYQPARKQLQDLIAGDAIGEVCGVKGELSYPLMDKERIVRPELAGGALLDVGIYPLTFASMVLGDDIVKTSSSTMLMETGVDTTDSITLWYRGGAVAQILTSAAFQGENTGLVYGTKGFLRIDNINNPSVIEVWNGRHSEHPARIVDVEPKLTGYEYEGLACKKAVETGALECPEMPHSEILTMMEQMDALRAQWGVRYPFE